MCTSELNFNGVFLYVSLGLQLYFHASLVCEFTYLMNETAALLFFFLYWTKSSAAITLKIMVTDEIILLIGIIPGRGVD